MSKLLSAAGLATLVLLTGCKTGFNRTHSQPKDPNPPPCAKEASNPNLSPEGRRVFKMLAGLTCSDIAFDGYIMGQNAGFGNEIAASSGERTYAALITAVDTATTHLPGLVSIDYEHDQIFTLDQLKQANQKLIDHWKAGGLVSISWSPKNPWNTSSLLYSDNVSLTSLVDDSTSAYDDWRERLDVIADALKELKDAGVPVLWRPLPEMNRDTFWWGTRASHINGETGNASRYTDLWEDMYEYFKEKELNNLLWVYSPGEGPSGTTSGPAGKSATWAYPGEKFVDVVAGIARNDSLAIKDYQALIDLERPFGMAEYSPTPAELGGALSKTPKTFDARTYADRLHGSYKAAGFWVSWHNTSASINDDEDVVSYMSLIDSDHLKDLTDRNYILSVERIKEHKLRD